MGGFPAQGGNPAEAPPPPVIQACNFDVEDLSQTRFTNTVIAIAMRSLFNFGTGFSIRDSITVTVANDDSTVVITGYAVFGNYQQGAGCIQTLQLEESAAILAGPKQSANIPLSQPGSDMIQVAITGVSAGSHTYDLRHGVNRSTGIGLFGVGISATVFGE